MCGIAGIASQEPIDTPAVFSAMKDALRHRGPDDEGTYLDPERLVGLVHTRLSVLDLSSAGHHRDQAPLLRRPRRPPSKRGSPIRITASWN